MKNLENYGVQEMNTKEIRDVDGGAWSILYGLIILGIYDSIEYPDAFIAGFKGEKFKRS